MSTDPNLLVTYFLAAVITGLAVWLLTRVFRTTRSDRLREALLLIDQANAIHDGRKYVLIEFSGPKKLPIGNFTAHWKGYPVSVSNLETPKPKTIVFIVSYMMPGNDPHLFSALAEGAGDDASFEATPTHSLAHKGDILNVFAILRPLHGKYFALVEAPEPESTSFKTADIPMIPSQNPVPVVTPI